jgi:hypothetical protein
MNFAMVIWVPGTGSCAAMLGNDSQAAAKSDDCGVAGGADEAESSDPPQPLSGDSAKPTLNRTKGPLLAIAIAVSSLIF